MSANLQITPDVTRSIHAFDVSGSKSATRAGHQDGAPPTRSNPAPAANHRMDVVPHAAQDAATRTGEGEAESKVERHQLDGDALRAITKNLNDVMNTFNKGLRFEVNEKIDALYVKIINKDTDEVIKTIPSEEVLRMMERMQSALGMILDAQV